MGQTGSLNRRRALSSESLADAWGEEQASGPPPLMPTLKSNFEFPGRLDPEYLDFLAWFSFDRFRVTQASASRPRKPAVSSLVRSNGEGLEPALRGERQAIAMSKNE